VGIHGDGRLAEGLVEHDVGRLSAHAGELDQILQAAGNLPPVALGDGPAAAPNGFGLLPEKPA